MHFEGTERERNEAHSHTLSVSRDLPEREREREEHNFFYLSLHSQSHLSPPGRHNQPSSVSFSLYHLPPPHSQRQMSQSTCTNSYLTARHHSTRISLSVKRGTVVTSNVGLTATPVHLSCAFDFERGETTLCSCSVGGGQSACHFHAIQFPLALCMYLIQG